MIAHNRDFLKLPSESGPCRNKICIGTDGCGNDSFVSLSNDDPRVFFVDHEVSEDFFDPAVQDFDWEHEELEKFPSLKAYVEEQIQIYEELW